MRFLLPSVLALGLVSCSTSGGGGSSNGKSDHSDKTVAIQGDLKSYQYTLPNGLTVVLTPNHRAPTTSIYHWVKVGSLQETPGITGIAHLFEHMMFRPLNKDAPSFDNLIRPLGGDINANTRYGATVYTTTVSNGKLSEALKIESDRFKKLVVTDDLLKVEREAVRSEYSMGIDSKPQMDLWSTLYSAGFPNHPYGWTIVGNRPDLDQISAKNCNEFFQKYYKPNNIGLFIAGDFDVEQAKTWILANYGDWKKGETPVAPPPFVNKGMIRAEGKLAAQSQNILLGYRLEPLTEKNFTLFTLADHVLADSSNSLAKNRLVYEQKLASSVGSFNTEYDFGLSEFIVTLKPGQSYDAVIDQFSKLSEDVAKLSDAEYAAYLQEYQINLAESVLRNGSLNSSLALYWGKYGSIDALAHNLKTAPTVSKAELTAYVGKLLDKNNLIAVTNKLKKD
ncbi:MAG: insulinase family protein [Oligoflexus sp.]|nr:insulinase family protein [Oligoflexus sp.]